MKRVFPPLAAAAALALAGCTRPLPCRVDQDCGLDSACTAGTCSPRLGQGVHDGGAEGEGEHDGGTSLSALVVLPGVEATGQARFFRLPLALDATELAIEDVAVSDCLVHLESIEPAAASPATLSLRCASLHLGELAVSLLVHSAGVEIEVELKVRLVPSDWHDLERAERELITIDTAGLLDGAAAPTGAPVFLSADQLPPGALQASPRLLFVEDSAVVALPFQADGHGLWFALPPVSRMWMYFEPTTDAPAPDPPAVPWADYLGVWHLDDRQDATASAPQHELAGEMLPAVGVIGGAAGFAGSAGLAATIDLAAGSGALSAWVKLEPAAARPLQAAVGLGVAEAAGAFDPAGCSIFTDADEHACAFVGAGSEESGTRQCSSGSPAALSDAGWHQVAVRWEGDARELIVDGEVRRSASGTPASGFAHQVLVIGGAVDLADPWFGAIDEVRLAARALPATWFRVEHASVTNALTDSGRPFVQGLRPDLIARSASVSPQGGVLPTVNVVPAITRGVLVTFVAARGDPASGVSQGQLALSPLAPSAEGAGISLSALSYEGALEGSSLSVQYAGLVPDDVVVGTVVFPGGSERGFAAVDLAIAPEVGATLQLVLPAATASASAWLLVAVASRDGVSCAACGTRALGPVPAGDGLVLEVFAGQREPRAHLIELLTGPGDEAAVVVVRVGP